MKLMKEEPEPVKRKRRTGLMRIEDSNHLVSPDQVSDEHVTHIQQTSGPLVRLLAELTSKN